LSAGALCPRPRCRLPLTGEAQGRRLRGVTEGKEGWGCKGGTGGAGGPGTARCPRPV